MDILLTIVITTAILLLILNTLLQFGSYGNHSKIIEYLSTMKARNDVLYERVWKIENGINNVLQASEALMTALDSAASENPMDGIFPRRIIRGPRGGSIMASSFEEFMSKAKNDPHFKSLTEEDLDKLKRMFEDNLSDEDTDDEEPWK